MSTRANAVNAADPGNVWLDVLVMGRRWDSGAPALTTIEVHVAGAGPVNFGGDRVTSFAARAQELAAVNRMLAFYESIINVDFVASNNINTADIWIAHVNNRDAGGSLGVAVFPGTVVNPVTRDAQGQMIINRDIYSSNNLSSLAQGGYDFVTYVHEFGHALGLDHPHDAPNRFPGVTSEFDDYGHFGMNQGIHTVMTYNDGYPAGPLGLTPSPLYGYAGGPMALDIAALQHLYGANMSYRTGNDVYRLPTANAAGTFYSCLWDAGGIDTIINPSAKASTINLNAATLAYAAGGGGFVSSVAGIHGGFTIANRAVIENAIGGAGSDTIVGNGAGNKLSGVAGNDVINGQGGFDFLVGGQGQDRLVGGVGADRFIYNALSDSGTAASQRDIVLDFQRGQDLLQVSNIDADATLAGNQSFVFRGEAPPAAAIGTADLWYLNRANANATLVYASVDADAAPEMAIQVSRLIEFGAVDFIL